jgi:hypothetical protein
MSRKKREWDSLYMLERMIVSPSQDKNNMDC